MTFPMIRTGMTSCRFRSVLRVMNAKQNGFDKYDRGKRHRRGYGTLGRRGVAHREMGSGVHLDPDAWSTQNRARSRVVTGQGWSQLAASAIRNESKWRYRANDTRAQFVP
jgi:hypothetical protein